MPSKIIGRKMKLSRELNKYTSLIIVLSVLLAISLVTGATFAWFASSERKVTTISLGDPVVVNIAANNTGEILADGADLPFTINNEYLLPGMRINTFAAVKFQASYTPALLRVKLNVSVEGSNATSEEIALLAEELNKQVWQKAKWNGESYPWICDSSTGWWYYTANKENQVEGDVKSSIVAAIDCETGPIISFLNPYEADQYLLLPTAIDNRYSTAKVTFWFSVQAVQALIPTHEEDPTGEYIVTTIRNVETVFQEAFAGSDSNYDPNA